MPSLEESERIGSALLLGVPAFDFFVWILDNYARMELLVRLHEHLPSFLINPVTVFVCLCIGLALLYASQRAQLIRVAQSTNHKLVDTSGVEYKTVEKPGWLLPVGIVFLITLFAAPLLGIFYSLAYKGYPPERPAAPVPPPEAYIKRKENKPKSERPLLPVQQECPQGICIAGNNSGNPTINNYGPPPPKVTYTVSELPISEGEVMWHIPVKYKAKITIKSDRELDHLSFGLFFNGAFLSAEVSTSFSQHLQINNSFLPIPGFNGFNPGDPDLPPVFGPVIS